MPHHRVRHSSRVAESWQTLVSLVAGLSGGHELAFRQAVFTAVGQFFLVIVLLICYQLYIVLQTFVKPLAWAALTGTILFPFKNLLAQGARGWIKDLKATSTPLTVGLILTPFQLVDWTFNLLGTEVLDFVWKHYIKILWGSAGLLGCFLAQLLLWNHMDVVVSLSEILGNALGFFSSKAIWFLILLYVLAVNFLWTPQHRRTLQLLAWPLWIWLGLHLSSLLGALAAPVLLIVAVVLCMGFATELKVVKSKMQRKQKVRAIEIPGSPVGNTIEKSESSFWMVLSSSVIHLVTDSIAEHEDGQSSSGSDEDSFRSPCSSFSAATVTVAHSEVKLFGMNKDKQGTRYMLYLFWMFVLVELLSHYYLIPLLLIPVLYRVARVFGQQKGAWMALADSTKLARDRCKAWVGSRRDIVAPAALRGLVKLAKQGDQKVLHLLDDSIDESVSLFLVLLMFVAMAISGLIVTMQVQQETVYLVGLSSDFMNETLVNHPEFMKWLPEGAQMQESVRTALDSTYLYARDWVVGSLREAISDTNATRAALIEKDILSLADRVYQFYVPRNRSLSIPPGFSKLRPSHLWSSNRVSNESNPLSPILSEFDEAKRWSVWTQLNQTWNKASEALDWSSATAYVKNNIDTLTSVMESIWNVCKGNFAMVFSLITTILSIFFMYFSALVRFIFCGLVYIAALYYLLCSSKDRYRPLDLIGVISPSVADSGHVAEIIEQTISDVIAASFKMAAFYGFFTWVLLSLFGIYIRFIPSVMASMLAVCPLVPPYVACIPALCELWFLRGEYIPAILMALGALLPSMFVDIAIYGDVKTAHPYMFGLSVAGGIVAMGLEGAVFGPVMLCILMVIVQVYRRILHHPVSNENVATGLNPDTLISPDTPDDKKSLAYELTEAESGSTSLRQDSALSYPLTLFNNGEEPRDTLDSTPSSPNVEQHEKRPEGTSSFRRRQGSASKGTKHSTPMDGSAAVAPFFFSSPISKFSPRESM